MAHIFIPNDLYAATYKKWPWRHRCDVVIIKFTICVQNSISHITCISIFHLKMAHFFILYIDLYRATYKKVTLTSQVRCHENEILSFCAGFNFAHNVYLRFFKYLHILNGTHFMSCILLSLPSCLQTDRGVTDVKSWTWNLQVMYRIEFPTKRISQIFLTFTHFEMARIHVLYIVLPQCN